MTGERTEREEMEVQARQQSHGTVVPAPEEAALPYFFSWAILNLTHPIKQPSNTTAATRRKKEAVSTLICLMWGVNHRFSHSRERLHRDRRFYTLSTAVLRQKKPWWQATEQQKWQEIKESPGNAQELDWSGPAGKEGNHSQKKTRRKEGEVMLEVWQKHPTPLIKASVINCSE